jgi:Domain of unknown function (DUF4249)
MKKYYMIFIIFTLFSCVEEYDPKITGEKNMLIVEALMTDKLEPYEVNLSRSISLNEFNQVIHERNAIVVISDLNGNETTLKEVSAGKYESNPSELQGELGKDYVLTIYTDDGKIYESDPVILVDVVDIDSVSISYREEFNFEKRRLEESVDINVTTKEWGAGDEYYLKWDYIETSKLVPTYSVMNRPEMPPNRPCYNIEKNSEIITDNTTLYSTNKISNKRIRSLSEDDTKPYFGYSIQIRQIALNEAVYQFWQMLEENTEENGDLFDNIPFNPISNITCVNDQSTKVFGYFNASRVAEKRISFDPPVFGIYFNNVYDNCVLRALGSDAFNKYLSGHNLDSLDVYVYDQVGDTIMFLTKQSCIDCSVNSTTIEKPDYWNFD